MSLLQSTRNDSVETTIKLINVRCSLKGEGVEVVFTKPQPHPTDPSRMIICIDLGSAIVLNKNDMPAEVCDTILNALGKMEKQLQNVKQEIALPAGREVLC